VGALHAHVYLLRHVQCRKLSGTAFALRQTAAMAETLTTVIASFMSIESASISSAAYRNASLSSCFPQQSRWMMPSWKAFILWDWRVEPDDDCDCNVFCRAQSGDGSIATQLDHDESASMNARSASPQQKVAKQRLHVVYRFYPSALSCSSNKTMTFRYRQAKRRGTARARALFAYAAF